MAVRTSLWTEDNSRTASPIIQGSTVFNKAQSQYLSKTFSSAGDRKTWTWSAWMKRSLFGSTQMLWSSNGSDNSNNFDLYWAGGNTLGAQGHSVNFCYTTNKFRDISTWHHVVFGCDTTYNNAGNRFKMWINGERIAHPKWGSAPEDGGTSQNDELAINRAEAHYIGKRSSGDYYDGYMSECYFIDGKQLDADQFGYSDPITGVWRPKKYNNSGSLSNDITHLTWAIKSSEQSSDGQLASNAFDRNLTDTYADRWRNNGSEDGNIVGNAYIGQDFQSGGDKDIREMRILQGRASSTGEMITGVKIQYSDNGSSWSDTQNSNGTGTTHTLETSYKWQTLTITSAGPHRYWRVLCSSSSNSVWLVTGLQMYEWLSTPYYGGNGYYLPMDGETALGADQSGNGNDWTLSGFTDATDYFTAHSPGGITYGAYNTGIGKTTGWPTDYCTLNPLSHRQQQANSTKGNTQLIIPASTTNSFGVGNMEVTSGKWYWEVDYDQAGGNGDYLYCGVGDITNWNELSTIRAVRGSDGELSPNTGTTAVRWTTGDKIMVALDYDNSKWYVGKNGSWMLSGDPVAGTGYVHNNLTNSKPLGPVFWNATGSAEQKFTMNCGGKPFYYEPPEGFRMLCSANIPQSTDAVIDPTAHVGITTYTGSGSTQKITGFGFKPDLVWIKCYDNSKWHVMTDSVRGIGKSLWTADAGVEASETHVTSFNKDGFTVDDIDSGTANESGMSYVAWAWKGGGPAVTNTVGSISAQVSANPEGGFSVVTYTVPSGGGGTFGHGLSKAPELQIQKNRDASAEWTVQFINPYNDSTDYMYLSTDAAAGDTSTYFYDTYSTSGFGAGDAGDKAVTYLFHSVPGLSKIGMYTATGGSGTTGDTKGPYVYCGFRPAFVFVKMTSGTQNWIMQDPHRYPPGNPCSSWLYCDLDAASEYGSGRYMDFVSDGFCIRSPGTGLNNSGSTYLYMAWADQPLNSAYGARSNAR